MKWGDPLFGLIRQRPVIKWVKAGQRYVRVGFVGWTTPETKVSSSPGDRVSFTDPVAGVKKCVRYLKRRGVGIIIGLGHAGATDDGDFNVAKNVPGEHRCTALCCAHSLALLCSALPRCTLTASVTWSPCAAHIHY